MSESNRRNTDSNQHRDTSSLDRMRAAMLAFTNVMEASELDGQERQVKLEESLSKILGDPALTEFFMELVEEDPDKQTHLLDEAREAMLNASDPFTGVIPDDADFSPEIKELIATSPALQAYREELVAVARGNDVRKSFVIDAVPPTLDNLRLLIDSLKLGTDASQSRAGAQRSTLTGWQHPINPNEIWGTAKPTEVDARNQRRSLGEPGYPTGVSGAALRGHQPVPNFRSRASSPSFQPRDIDDPKGVYRLRETPLPTGAGKFDVILSIYKPGSLEPLVASRDEWRVFPTLDGQDLPTEPDEYTDTAWKLADPISPEDLARVGYEVEVVSICPDDEASLND